jgi:hypothetical protein
VSKALPFETYAFPGVLAVDAFETRVRRGKDRDKPDLLEAQPIPADITARLPSERERLARASGMIAITGAA